MCCLVQSLLDGSPASAQETIAVQLVVFAAGLAQNWKKKFFLPKVLIRIILDTHFGGGKDIRQITVSFFSFTIFEKQLPILFWLEKNFKVEIVGVHTVD